MARAGPGAPGAAIKPGREGEIAWLYQVALSGLLDQLRDANGRRLLRYEVGETILGRTVSQMTNLFRVGLHPVRPDELADIEERLHSWAAENYDPTAPPARRRAPDDPRHYLLTTLYARISQQPRSAPLHVPGAWFEDLASMLVDTRGGQPSPIQVIAAGHALVASIEVLDRIPKDARFVSLATLRARQKVFARLDGTELGSAAGEADKNLASTTVELLLQGAQLPPFLFGAEASALLGRLRLPEVLWRTERRIRTDGVGARLWRVFAFMLQVERELAAKLNEFGPEERLERLVDTSVVDAIDGHLLALLTDAPGMRGYPAQGLHLEPLQQRLRFHDEIARGIAGGPRQVRRIIFKAFPRTEEIVARCGELLRSQIEDVSIPERDRAFATEVFVHDASGPMESLGLPAAKVTPQRLRAVGDGILGHALTAHYQAYEQADDRSRAGHPLHDLYVAIANEASPMAWRGRSAGRTFRLDLDREHLDDTIRRVRRFVAESIEDSEEGVFIPDALLSGPRGSRRYGTRHDVPSAFGELLVTLLTSYDAVARRHCADALRTGMLSNAAAPILAELLVDQIDDWTVPTWVRDLAMSAIMHLSPVDNPRVVTPLVRYASAGETMSDGDSRVWLAHDATWTLGEYVIDKIVHDPQLGRDRRTHDTFSEIRDALYRASWSPSIRVRRASAYALVVVNGLDLDSAGLGPLTESRTGTLTTRSMVDERLGLSDHIVGSPRQGVAHPMTDDDDVIIAAHLRRTPVLIEMLRRGQKVRHMLAAGHPLRTVPYQVDTDSEFAPGQSQTS
jgi:hypothetical protein